MIDFAAVPVKELPDTDWIFFTSKNSVKYFFKQNFDLSNIKVACVGRGTYKELSKYVDYVSFIGDAVDIVEIGTDFAKVVGGERCVFPVSNISKRTIQNQFLDQSNIKDIVVYSTSEQLDFTDPKANVLIFTSPSNVRAYFKKITWQPYQKIIVMGPTTAKQLADLGMFNYFVPELTGELGLIDLLQ